MTVICGKCGSMRVEIQHEDDCQSFLCRHCGNAQYTDMPHPIGAYGFIVDGKRWEPKAAGVYISPEVIADKFAMGTFKCVICGALRGKRQAEQKVCGKEESPECYRKYHNQQNREYARLKKEKAA
jgi:hypothetical protein